MTKLGLVLPVLAGCMINSVPDNAAPATLDVHVKILTEKKRITKVPRAMPIGPYNKDAYGLGSTILGIGLFGYAGSDEARICFAQHYQFKQLDATPADVVESFTAAMKDERIWFKSLTGLSELVKVPAWPMPPGAVALTSFELLEDTVTEQDKQVVVEGGGTATMAVKIRYVTMGLCVPGPLPASTKYLAVGVHTKPEGYVSESEKPLAADSLTLFELE